MELVYNEFVRRKMRGFTLIELILVMAIVGILAVVGIGAFTSATVKSRDTQRKNDLNQIAKALESFINDVGRYPLVDADGIMTCPEYDGSVLTEKSCYGSLMADIGDSNSEVYTKAYYMVKIPTDPDKSRKYIYKKTDTGYALYTALENAEDRDVVKDTDGSNTNWDSDGGMCGTNISCTYKLTDTGLVRINTE